MNYYVNVQGGTGLNLAFASFLVEAKQEHPDDNYYVCSPYFDIFQCCPAVSGVYKPNELRDLIFDCKEDTNGMIITHRLYDMDDFIFKRINYSQAWAKLFGYDDWKDTEKGTRVRSVLNPLSTFPMLQQMVDNMLNTIKANHFKDFIIVQFTGGQSPLVQAPIGPNGQPDFSKVPYDYMNEPLKRHYPIDKATEFCKLYHEKHPETAIVNYGLPNEPCPDLPYVVRTMMPYLAWYELAKKAKQIICIDSSLMHLTAGLKCNTVVIWGHSKPENFGYSYNKNIEQKCRTDDLLYFSALGPSGAKITYIEPEDLLKETE